MIYAGGFFIHIGGQPRNRIAALDAATGLATGWDPNSNDLVTSFAVSPTTVYAGGYFSGMGETPARGIAAISAQDFPVPALAANLEAELTVEGVRLKWDIHGAKSLDRLTILRGDARGQELAVANWVGAQTAAAGSWLDADALTGGRFRYRLVGQILRVQLSSPEVVVEVVRSVLGRSHLISAVPNPFNPSTRLEYQLARAGRITLGIYDLAGRLIREMDLGSHTAGRGAAEWDGRDGEDHPVSSGVYLVQMHSETGNDHIRVALIK
jgi:hypothetical protein